MLRPEPVRVVPPAFARSDAAAAPAAGRTGRAAVRAAPLGASPAARATLAPRLREIAAAAEAAGFDAIYTMDHFRQIPQVGRAWDDFLESFTTLAWLAACTTRVRLGALVAGVTYRNVGHLAKIVATLDVLSGGRAVCGLGLGWFAAEHRAYGWPFPPVGERYALLEDALAALPVLWGPGGKPFRGRVLDLPDTAATPVRCRNACRSCSAAGASGGRCARRALRRRGQRAGRPADRRPQGRRAARRTARRPAGRWRCRT